VEVPMSADTGHALRWAILEDPIDDAPRLIYADWLEETGDEWNVLYAEVIRLEVWLARADRRRAVGDWSTADKAEYDRLIDRLADLWWPHHYKWFREIDRDDVDRGFRRTVRMSLARFPEEAVWPFRRHPITAVRFYEHLRHPDWETDLVVQVRSDWRNAAGQGWWAIAGRWPVELFPGQEGTEFHFQTMGEAAAVLSDAAVAYGRRAAGLPELRLPHQL
jgi:uncharacterized protein (TIGR02996 family)